MTPLAARWFRAETFRDNKRATHGAPLLNPGGPRVISLLWIQDGRLLRGCGIGLSYDGLTSLKPTNAWSLIERKLSVSLTPCLIKGGAVLHSGEIAFGSGLADVDQ